MIMQIDVRFTGHDNDNWQVYKHKILHALPTEQKLFQPLKVTRYSIVVFNGIRAVNDSMWASIAVSV
jgi:hypothetical protein